MNSQIVIDSIIKAIKSNASSIRLIDIIVLCENEKFKPYKDFILQIPFSELISDENISSESECEALLIANHKEIVNLNLSEIMKKLKIQNKTILTKTLKFLESENSTGYRISYSGERKGKRYTLLTNEDYVKKMNKNSTDLQSIEELLDQDDLITSQKQSNDSDDEDLDDDDYDLEL